ncbi:MAG TPA: glycosyltransferase family 4 protein [Candidatus Saccharimonadales bacterium]
MRILQVISYGYLAGGAEKSVLLLKEYLEKHGHQVRIVASSHRANPPQHHFADYEFEEIDTPNRPLLAKALDHLWYRPSHKALRQAIAEFTPDIVHFHTMGQLSPSAIFAIAGTPAILTVHGPEEYTRGLLEWSLPKQLFRAEHITKSQLSFLGKGYYFYFKFLQRPIYNLAFRRHITRLLAPSRYMANVLEKENYRVPIRQLYNGIELPPHQKIQNRHNLLYVGRLEHVKGVDVLLEALRIVAKQLPTVHLSIVGDGAIRPQLEQFVHKYQLSKHVTFCGWLKGKAVYKKYAESTAVVIPSIWPENLPTVCLEALATGRPVIGTKSGGIPELIDDGTTGRLVAKGSAAELASAIHDVLSWPHLAKVSKACRASMKSFSIEAFIQNITVLYQQEIRPSSKEAL